ncbi:heparanase-like isoform X2 [Mytilus galloprovincialis]|uniref:heparanase-like isoform X2 n=1 Tax=Mytilus galloprovincialis TaxID=29158 RepID=UPI003F7C1A9B
MYSPVCVLWYLLYIAYSNGSKTKVFIHTDNVIQTIPDRFLSVTIDTALIQANWATLNFSFPKIQRLAEGLAPCYLRVGGSSADFLQFNPGVQREKNMKRSGDEYLKFRPYKKRNIPFEDTLEIQKLKNFTMSGKQWDQLNHFVEVVGWDLIFDLNGLLRQDGLWLPDNAKLLMDYTSQKGYKIAGWELGNEPDAWTNIGYRITASQHANDYRLLHTILNQYSQWKNSTVIGPSTTGSRPSFNYLKNFLDAGGPDIVSHTTFHHYYGHGPDMTVAKFMDPKLLDSLKHQIKLAQGLAPYPKYGKVWLGETSSAWGGGAAGLSDRYVAGFMWLDKLGVSASLGIEVVIRQDFYGNNYGLIDPKTLDPNPDLWSSYLFKILVGKSVLNVTIDDKSGNVRMYAHCTNTKRTNYKPGSITLYGMNLRTEPTTVTFPQFIPDIKLYLYMLEPVGKEGLKSQTVALNGKTLKVSPDLTMSQVTDIPEIVNGTFTFPQQSYGFIVISDANVAACKNKV